MIRLLHISDSHGYADGTNDAISLAEDLNAHLVHTGDWVKSIITHDSSYAPIERFLFAVGNHDVCTGEESNGLPVRAQNSAIVSKYFDGFDSVRGIVRESDKTYWYKDIGQLRIIGIDQFMSGSELADELAWLEHIIDGCRYCVILAHMTLREASVLDCSMSCYSYWHGRDFAGDINAWGKDSIASVYSMLQQHREKVMCVLCGHDHADGVFMTDGFPTFVVGSTSIDGYNNVSRSREKLIDRCVANVIDIEPGVSIVVRRLGAFARATGERAFIFTYDMQNNHRLIVSR
jgi:predicted phosphodiesterase|nr:MAG TPA: purple acid phosphatase [Caudoviricetes sp.]